MNLFLSFLRILGYHERRKARNLLLKPAFQLKLSIYILILSATFGSLALWVGDVAFKNVYVLLLEDATHRMYFQQVIDEQVRNVMRVSIALFAGYIVLVIAVTAIFTHRLIGPAVAITRHIRALKEGLYAHRVRLRKNDELEDLADELNELAEILEQERAGGSVTEQGGGAAAPKEVE